MDKPTSVMPTNGHYFPLSYSKDAFQIYVMTAVAKCFGVQRTESFAGDS